MSRSVALDGNTYSVLRAHLLRPDRQEDLVFALWRPSQGLERTTALIREVVLPLAGDRDVHGNVSFRPSYLERSIGEALAAGAGLAFLHSHPSGRGWQGLSPDDRAAERGNAGRVFGATDLPPVGLTMAGDGAIAARFWEHGGRSRYDCIAAESVRVIGEGFGVTFDDRLVPPPRETASLARTVSAWGSTLQRDLTRLKIGVVGLGSVGSIVAEALARTGIRRIRLIDFDSVKTVNLDRLLGTDERDVALGRSKVESAARRLRRSSRAKRPEIEVFQCSVIERDGFRAALDCDVLFSCVDRPAARAALNFAAFAHLIPVVDGGIVVRTRRGEALLGADWRAHVAAPGRRCLECLGQYDAGLVQADRAGDLDDPRYLAGLPPDHAILQNQNVFIFGAAAASLELLQFILMVAMPAGVADVGALTYHAVTAAMDVEERGCEPRCPYSQPPVLAGGDRTGLEVTTSHLAATTERAARDRQRRQLRVRALRVLSWATDILEDVQHGAASRIV
jgi:molybdopterin-synthase adenylyltransferase